VAVVNLLHNIEDNTYGTCNAWSAGDAAGLRRDFINDIVYAADDRLANLSGSAFSLARKYRKKLIEACGFEEKDR